MRLHPRGPLHRALLLGSVAVASFATLPAHASHFGYPLVASETLASGEWVRYELAVTADAMVVTDQQIIATDVISASLADWVLIPGGDPIASGLSLLRGGRGARFATAAGALVEEEPGRTTSTGQFVSFSEYDDLPAGPVSVIASASSDGGAMEGRVNLYGDGFTVTSVRRGTGAFGIDERGFATAAYARGPRGEIDAGIAAETTVTTDAPLYAWFLAHADIASTSYDGPARTQSRPWIVLWGEPAGAHRFAVQAEVGTDSATGWDLVGAPVA